MTLESNEPTYYENGYPSRHTLNRIRYWKFEDGYINLMEYVRKAWHWNDYVRSVSKKNDFDQDITEYTLITGGWSGNEDIVFSLERNRLFYALCWRESHRGGKHVYEVRINNDKNEAEAQNEYN